MIGHVNKFKMSIRAKFLCHSHFLLRPLFFYSQEIFYQVYKEQKHQRFPPFPSLRLHLPYRGGLRLPNVNFTSGQPNIYSPDIPAWVTIESDSKKLPPTIIRLLSKFIIKGTHNPFLKTSYPSGNQAHTESHNETITLSCSTPIWGNDHFKPGHGFQTLAGQGTNERLIW